MPTSITYRSAKGSPLTSPEIDANFLSLATNKVEQNSTGKSSAVQAPNVLVNGSGELADLGWLTTNYQSTQDNTTLSGRQFANAAAITTGASVSDDSAFYPVVPGINVNVQGEVSTVGATAGQAYLKVTFYDSSQVVIGTGAFNTTPLVFNNGFTWATANGAVPAGAAYLKVSRIADTSPRTISGGIKFRRIKLEYGNSPSTYSQEASLVSLMDNPNGELVLDVSTADVTLTADQAAKGIYRFTGALTGNRVVTVPALPHNFVVQNLTTNAFSLTLKAAGQTPSASIIQGKASTLFSDATGVFATSAAAGMQFAKLFPYSANQTLDVSHLGAMIVQTGVGSLTKLPLANTYPAGSGIGFSNYSTGAASFQTQGSDTCDLVTPYSTSPNDTFFLYSDGVSKWSLGWYSNKFTPTYDSTITAKGGIKFADGTTQTSATSVTLPTSVVYSIAIGNTTLGATSLTTGGYVTPFVTIYKNGARLTKDIDFTLPGDNVTINLLTGVANLDNFEVITNFTYNPSTVYLPSSTLVTPAFGATSIAMGYVPGFVFLYQNGSRLVPGVDFNAGDGANINFLTFKGDGITQIEVQIFTPITPANCLSASNAVLTGPLTFSDGSQLSSAPLGGRKNWFQNGAMSVWQRGTSFSSPTGVTNMYTADRWVCYRGVFAAGLTTAKISSGGAANSHSAMQLNRTVGDTSTQPIFLATSFETIDVLQMQGRQMTLSYDVYGSGAFAGATFGMSVLWGTGTDGNVPAGFTGQAIVATKNTVLQVGWQRVSLTFTVPATATQFGIAGAVTPSATAAVSGDWFAFTAAQLEFGAVATPFELYNYGDYLQRCQRFYQVGINVSVRAYAAAALATYDSAIGWVPMRAAPTLSLGSSGTQANCTNSGILGVNAAGGRAEILATAAGDAYIANWLYNATAEI